MKKLFTLPLLICYISCMSSTSNSKPQQELPFPAPAKGEQRFVIELPKKSDESLLRVEILPGKSMKIDCNRHFLDGELTEHELKGWGYTYYKFKTSGSVGSTLMACPDDSKRTAFVEASGKTVQYNSKLPIVVYTPSGYSVRYRIWSAGATADGVMSE